MNSIRILMMIVFCLSLKSISIAQVLLDANTNVLTYDEKEERVTIPEACVCIKGSGGIVSENGKRTICPNKATKQKCAKLSIWDAIRYKLNEIFSSPDTGGEELILNEELSICSRDDDSLNFVFLQGSRFKMTADGVFQTALENMIIVND